MQIEISLTTCELLLLVAMAAAMISVVLLLVGVIIYQRWRIGDQNVFLERFIHQNEELRLKLNKAGLL